MIFELFPYDTGLGEKVNFRLRLAASSESAAYRLGPF